MTIKMTIEGWERAESNKGERYESLTASPVGVFLLDKDGDLCLRGDDRNSLRFTTFGKLRDAPDKMLYAEAPYYKYQGAPLKITLTSPGFGEEDRKEVVEEVFKVGDKVKLKEGFRDIPVKKFKHCFPDDLEEGMKDWAVVKTVHEHDHSYECERDGVSWLWCPSTWIEKVIESTQPFDISTLSRGDKIIVECPFTKGFTEGKQYTAIVRDTQAFTATNDSGHRCLCLFTGCAHLNGKDWKIIRKISSSSPEESPEKTLQASDFKVGMKVKIKENAKELSEIYEPLCCWPSSMRGTQGETGEITHANHHRNRYQVKCGDQSWFYPHECLEILPDDYLEPLKEGDKVLIVDSEESREATFREYGGRTEESMLKCFGNAGEVCGTHIDGEGLRVNVKGERYWYVRESLKLLTETEYQDILKAQEAKKAPEMVFEVGDKVKLKEGFKDIELHEDSFEACECPLCHPMWATWDCSQVQEITDKDSNDFSYEIENNHWVPAQWLEKYQPKRPAVGDRVKVVKSLHHTHDKYVGTEGVVRGDDRDSWPFRVVMDLDGDYWYFKEEEFEIIETPKDSPSTEFKVGDKVVLKSDFEKITSIRWGLSYDDYRKLTGKVLSVSRTDSGGSRPSLCLVGSSLSWCQDYFEKFSPTSLVKRGAFLKSESGRVVQIVTETPDDEDEVKVVCPIVGDSYEEFDQEWTESSQEEFLKAAE